MPDEREQRQRRRQRAGVERRELGRVRPEPAEQHARVLPRERAVARWVDHPVGRCRPADELEPWQQRNGGQAQRSHPGAQEDRQATPAQLHHKQDERGRCRDGGQLLRAAEYRARERGREHERRGSPPLTPRRELGRGNAGCQPGRACQQPERLRAREQVARHAECEARVRGSEAPGAREARERVRRERREQVVEGDQKHHPGGRREEAVGHERGRVEDARLRIGRERLAREREGIPERQVAVPEAVVEERRERRVEGVGVVRVRQMVRQRQRGQHERCDQRDGGDRRHLAGTRPGGQTHARER